MTYKTILLVDDEKPLVKGLKFSLEQESFTVETAFDGEEAFEKFQSFNPDLIILDLMLPKIDGLSLCRLIREKSQVPIIMLTAKTEDIDKIIGLELGADDYLGKPFNTRELIARIKAVLRKSQKGNLDSSVLKYDQLTIDIPKRKLLIKDSKINLTEKEFDLLLLFAKNPGRVYTRDNLLESIWGYNFLGDTRTVDVHIRRLREKIEVDPANPEFILTKWGVGYFFRELA